MVLLAALLVLSLTAPEPISVHIGVLLLALQAVAISLFAGLWPGLGATAIGLAIGLAIGPERGVSSLWSGLIFCAIGLGAAFGGEWALKLRRQNAASQRVLQERDAHLRSIFDTAPEAMIVIDEQGMVQSYGASAERMFGWRSSEVLGRNVNMLMPAPFREQHDGYIRRYLDTGERRIIGIGRIVVGLRKDGATFPMDLAVGEVRSEHGRFFTGFVQDLTERREHESKVHELQADLSQMARVNEMGQMASALAHELNQPLSAISNYLSGARRLLERQESKDAKLVEALEQGAAQALRAGEIIRRLRSFLGRGDGEREAESLSKLVYEACALALVGVKPEGVDISYQFDPHGDRAMVDRIQIQQVVVNLVRNSRDAMLDQPKKEMIIATSVEGALCTISVRDTGAGVSEEIAARLFEPFTTNKPQGMGVGLSISRTIVEEHGGRIWAEPNPGGGAVFSFTVPLAPGGEQP